MPAHAVVVADPALLLEAEHVAPMRLGHLNEGRGRLVGGHREAAVVLSQVDLAQEPVGGLDGGASGQRQLLGQTVLEGAKGALAAAPGLRRVGRDVADAELLERPSDLGQLGLGDFAASLGGDEVVAAAVGVELDEQAMPLDHLDQPAEAAQRVPSSSTKNAE